MKTKNNVQNSGKRKLIYSSMKIFVLFICLALFSISAYSNSSNSKRQTKHENELILNSPAIPNFAHFSVATTAFDAFSIEILAEESMEIENWMIDASHFESQISDLELDAEDLLNIEEWMLNDFNSSTTFYHEKQCESELKIEAWMLDESLQNK